MSASKRQVAIISNNPKIHWSYIQYHTDTACPFCRKIRPEFKQEIPLNYARIKYKYCKICRARSTKQYQTYPQTRMINLIKAIEALCRMEESPQQPACGGVIALINDARRKGLKV